MGLIFYCIPIIAHWLSGKPFERSPTLALTFLICFIFGIVGLLIAKLIEMED
jgi:hypothetical protein